MPVIPMRTGKVTKQCEINYHIMMKIIKIYFKDFEGYEFFFFCDQIWKNQDK